jgi:hypothetical protein
MTFTPDDFTELEAQRHTLVQRYITQRDERRARENGATMTEDELTAIEARANAAASGPWRVDGLRIYGPEVGHFNEPAIAIYHEGTHTRNDAEFIASARTDVPALVAEVRRLRALCVRSAEHLVNHHDCGPFAEGWQSDELRALVKELEAMK